MNIGSKVMEEENDGSESSFQTSVETSSYHNSLSLDFSFGPKSTFCYEQHHLVYLYAVILFWCGVCSIKDDCGNAHA